MKLSSSAEAAEPAPPAIEMRDLSRRFGSVQALDRVSIDVQPGELFFLLGPSGCGKTTLLRILAGLETPDSGALRFEGRDILNLPPHRRGAPMVFQNYALWPHLSVRENVAFGLVERRVPKAEIRTRALDVLRRVGLEGLEGRMPGQLSGGQQQRVVLARALVLNPKIVLLDEPLSNLDAKLRLEMREEIEKLHADTGITFVYVTHDQAEALSLADRMAVMDAGRISAVGTPSELYHRPPNVFCAEFLGETNTFPATVAGSEGGRTVLRMPFGEWRAVCAGGTTVRNGASVHCMVRPENLALASTSAPAGAGLNSLRATVESIRLNGTTVTVLLAADGMRLKAALLNNSLLDIRLGQVRDWVVDPANAVVLGPAPGGAGRA